jgi:hypothetical protein
MNLRLPYKEGIHIPAEKKTLGFQGVPCTGTLVNFKTTLIL